jgi:serine/threonine-protein kinase
MRKSERRNVDAVLTRALELSDEARARFLDEACSGQAGLRARLERLLTAGESNQSLLTPGGGASGPLWTALAGECPEAHPETPEPRPGDRIGAYRIVRALGQGGMATVYLAERADGQFEQTAALKVLDSARYLSDAADRFAQERQILATLDHPHIAHLIDGGSTEAGRPYVVMEYVHGRPIDRYCDEERLTIDQRIALFDLVAGAVQYAHSHLIVHRDIKPSNILVTPDGQPKLLDFGIAKLLDAGAPHTAPETRDALHPMTPEYASPEQLRGEPLTTVSDVYQLGFLLYHLLTGRAPYACDRYSISEVVRVVCTVQPVSPSQAIQDAATECSDASADARSAARSTTAARLRKRLAGDLDNVVLTALRKDPARRYPSVIHLRGDLERYLDGMPVTARRPTVRYRTAKFIARHRLAVAGGALIVLAIAAGIASTVWQASATAREAQRAEAAFEFLVGLFESADPDVTLGEPITAKELLDRGAARLDTEAAGAPLMRAEMLSVIGGMYTDLGLYEQALPLLEEARTVFLRSREGNAGIVARNADRLATVLHEMGRYEEAAEVAQQAIALREEDGGATPEELSASIGNLASIRSLQGLFDEADALYREVLEVDRRVGNERLLASHLSDYSASLYQAGRYVEAQRTGEESLTLHRTLYGPAHTLVATSLLNLGTVYMALGEYDSAEELLRECLAIRRQLLGEEHPHVALALSNLGHLMRSAGRLDEAEGAHRQALSIRRAALGPSHPDVATTLNNLGVVLYFDGRYDEAAETFEQVVPLWREVYGDRHPNVFTVLNNLGAARREAGDYDRAERVLRMTLELRREAFGESHRQVAQSLNNLALLLAEKGVDGQAESLMREAVAMWRETMGENHPDVGDGLMSLGRFLLDQDRCAEAEVPLRESFAIRARTLDADAPMLASTRLYLAECLVTLGRHGEAKPLLAASLPVLVDHWGEDAEITQRAHRATAGLAQ